MNLYTHGNLSKENAKKLSRKLWRYGDIEVKQNALHLTTPWCHLRIQEYVKKGLLWDTSVFKVEPKRCGLWGNFTPGLKYKSMGGVIKHTKQLINESKTNAKLNFK